MKRLALLGALLLACGGATQDTTTTASTPAPSASAGAAPASPAAPAAIGKPAPDFTLNDVNGKPYTLGQLRGKAVILEWFNPGCGQVSESHKKGALAQLAARAQKVGIVYLAINSNAPGTIGSGVDNNKAGIAALHLPNPVLLDDDGKVGHAYGATKTPEMFVVDPAGNLVYRGAVDDVEAALADLAAARPVQKPETTPNGCAIEYRSH